MYIKEQFVDVTHKSMLETDVVIGVLGHTDGLL